MPQKPSPYLVKDVLEPGLTLIFCGTAPSRESARQKAYYAHPGNRFWPILYQTGITPHQFKPSEYGKLAALGIGLTDICKTASGNDDELPEGAIDCEAVKRKILQFQPRLVGFTSKYTATRYFGHKVEYGLQQQMLGKTRFFVLCSTSGRARRFFQEGLWMELATIYKEGICSR